MTSSMIANLAFGLSTLAPLLDSWMYDTQDYYCVFIGESQDKAVQVEMQLKVLDWTCVPQIGGGFLFCFRKGI